MKDTVTLKEIIAIAVRRGRLAIILALVFALFLGGWRTYDRIQMVNSKDNSPEKIEERYQEAMKIYKENKINLESQLAQAEAQLEAQRKYNDKSFLMEIDPYSKAVTTINLAITDVDERAFQQVFRLETTPIDFIISKIQSQYIILWNSLDLQTSLRYTPRASMEDKYIREIVTLSLADGGCLTLAASGPSEEETRKLANAAYDCLLELQSSISKGSYLHGFVLLSNVTKITVDNSLESIQVANLEKVTTYTDSITSLSEEIKALKEPERDVMPSVSKMISSIVKYAVLGAAVGVMLALVWSLVSYLFRNRAETSRQLEEGLGIPFLGSIARRGGLWNCLADCILSERRWPDEVQALNYISATAKVLLPASGSVLLASTLPLEEEAVQAVLKVIEGQGRTVHFVGDAGRNPETAEAVRSCGCIVLAERAGDSRWEALTELTSLAKNLDKSVAGFIVV